MNVERGRMTFVLFWLSANGLVLIPHPSALIPDFLARTADSDSVNIEASPRRAALHYSRIGKRRGTLQTKAKAERRKVKGSGRYFLLFPFLFSLCCAATAQTYPVKPIRLISTYAPGGNTDA